MLLELRRERVVELGRDEAGLDPEPPSDLNLVNWSRAALRAASEALSISSVVLSGALVGAVFARPTAWVLF